MTKDNKFKKAILEAEKQTIDKPHSRKQEKVISNQPKTKKIVSGHFDPAVNQQLRLIAVKQDRTLQDVLGEAINDFFEKYGKSRLVE